MNRIKTTIIIIMIIKVLIYIVWAMRRGCVHDLLVLQRCCRRRALISLTENDSIIDQSLALPPSTLRLPLIASAVDPKEGKSIFSFNMDRASAYVWLLRTHVFSEGRLDPLYALKASPRQKHSKSWLISSDQMER